MSRLKSFATKLWKDESGQGTAEYVLLLVIVVALLMAFKNQIKTKISEMIGNISSGMDSISSGN